MDEHSDRYMRASDAFTWYMERDPLLRSTIVTVALLDGAPDWERVVRRVELATHRIPGLRRRLVETPLRLATPRWVDDPDFDLGFHVRRVSAPAPGSVDDVLEIARAAAMDTFDTARPLWEFTLVEGIGTESAAFVMKVHHSLMDGIGAVQLAAHLFDLASDATDPAGDTEETSPAAHPFDALGMIGDTLAHNFRQAADFAFKQASKIVPSVIEAASHPRQVADQALRTAASIARMVAPAADRRSPVMKGRRHASQLTVLDVPHHDLRRAAAAAGGTLNDGFLAGVVGGLRRYHEHHGSPVEELRVTMPVSIRLPSDPPGGNRITLMRFPIPVTIDDPVERMRSLHDIVRRQRDEPAIRHTNTIAGVLNLLPQQVVGSMLKQVDFVASNVPGVDLPLYLAEAKVRRLYPFGPPTGTAVNVTLLSYDGTCCIGINADSAAVPDLDVFHRCVDEGFAEVLEVGRAG